LAIYYRSMGPQRPKFQYEIEKELGIEPPDLEAIYNQKLREEAEREAEIKSPQQIIYHYQESKDVNDKAVINPPSDETVR